MSHLWAAALGQDQRTDRAPDAALVWVYFSTHSVPRINPLQATECFFFLLVLLPSGAWDYTHTRAALRQSR